MGEILMFGAGVLWCCYLIFSGIRDGLIRKETRGAYGVERLTGVDAVRQGWVQIGLGIAGIFILAYAVWLHANR